MRIDVKKIITTNEILPLLLGGKTEEGIHLGEMDIHSIDKGRVAFMDIWTDKIDRRIEALQHIHEVRKTQWNQEEYNYIQFVRGISFAEYQEVFYTPIDDHKNDWTRYPAFRFLNIINERQRQRIIHSYTQDTEGYLKALQDMELDIWRFFLRNFSAILPSAALQKHSYICGKTGSGKTELLKLIFYYLQQKSQDKRDKSLILIDPHGDLAEELLLFDINTKAPDRIVYIDPLQQGYTTTINPLEIFSKDKNTIIVRAEQLVTAIDEIVGDAKLSPQMKTILMPCLTTLLIKGDATLLDLITFMDDDRNDALVTLGKQNYIEGQKHIFINGLFFDNNYNRTKTSIKTRIQGLLNFPAFYTLTIGQSTLNLEQAINEGKIIIFRLPPMIGDEASSAIGRLLIASIAGIAKRRSNDPKHSRKTMFLFIDEFQNYITQSIGLILSQARKWKLHLVLANQYLGQVKDTNIEAEILGNTQVKIAGINDPEVSKKIINSLKVNPNDFQKLKQHDFYLKAGDRTPYKFKPSSFLLKPDKYEQGNLNSYLMDYEELQDLKKYLFEQSGYYRTSEENNIDQPERQTNEQPYTPAFPNKPKPKFDL